MEEALIEEDQQQPLCEKVLEGVSKVYDVLSLGASEYDLAQQERTLAHLKSHLDVLTQMTRLTHAKEDLQQVAADVKLEKSILKKKIEETWQKLQEMRTEYLAQDARKQDNFVVLSSIQLALAEYQRKKDLYTLFNSIEDLVQTTQTETERILKMSLYSQQFNSLTRCKQSSLGFDGVLDDLLSHMAHFGKTTDYINAQLSLAKSSNVSSSSTAQIDRACREDMLKNFLHNGHVHEEVTEKKEEKRKVAVLEH